MPNRASDAELLAGILHARAGRWLELEGVFHVAGFGDVALAGELDWEPDAGPVYLRRLGDGQLWRADITITARPAEPGEPGTHWQRPGSPGKASGSAMTVPGAVPADDPGSRRVPRLDGHEAAGAEPPGPPQAPHSLLDPDPEFRALDTGELMAMAVRAGESVLRRGRALMELGRRASSDQPLLEEVARMIRDPGNRQLITVGTVSVSQLGTAGLLAGGGTPAAALAREVAAQWPAGERSDFAWLMKNAGITWARGD